MFLSEQKTICTAKTLVLIARSSCILSQEVAGSPVWCCLAWWHVHCTCVLRTKTSEFRNVAWPALPTWIPWIYFWMDFGPLYIQKQLLLVSFSLPGVRTPLRFWCWYTSPVKGFMSLCWEGPFSWVGKVLSLVLGRSFLLCWEGPFSWVGKVFSPGLGRTPLLPWYVI